MNYDPSVISFRLLGSCHGRMGRRLRRHKAASYLDVVSSRTFPQSGMLSRSWSIRQTLVGRLPVVQASKNGMKPTAVAYRRD